MSKKQNLNHRHLERIVRGFSNHRRIQMLELLDSEPELALIDIVERLNIEYKTASEHARRLAITGLVLKRSAGNNVRHKLSPRGQSILKFLRTLE